MQQQVVLPNKCIGIIGGGQLGQMLTIYAQQAGYKVAILEPILDCPAAQYATHHICANYNDKEALSELAELADVITTEFENVPAESMEFLNSLCPTYPNVKSIRIAQDRLLEKEFFNSMGLRTTDYLAVNKKTNFQSIPKTLFPAILKTSTLGYDGKGQISVNNIQELERAFAKLNHTDCILEKKIDIKSEISIIIARNSTGTQVFPLFENSHKNGILDTSVIPANCEEHISRQIIESAKKAVQVLDYVGILTIEFFITSENQVLANEMAPRTHNSGHISIEACNISQFEQQLKAICGLPLSSVTINKPGIMLNILGDSLINNQKSFFETVANYPELKLHWYGKKIAKSGRKMAHLSYTDQDEDSLEQKVMQFKLHLNKSN